MFQGQIGEASTIDGLVKVMNRMNCQIYILSDIWADKKDQNIQERNHFS